MDITSIAAPVKVLHDPQSGEFFTESGDVMRYRFFPLDRKFITIEGETIFFRLLNSQGMFSIAEAFKAKYKPKIPMIAIEYKEGEFTLQGNERDPAYIDAINDYHQALGLFLLERSVSLSCKVPMPEPADFEEDFLWKLDSAGVDVNNPQELKDKLHRIRYMWIMHLMTDEQELAVFLNIVAGQSLPTRSALAVAEERFPSQA